MEALGHMSILQDKEEAEVKTKEFERWINFLSLVNSHPPQDDDAVKTRKEFIDLIKPKVQGAPPQKFETDIELLKQIKAQQEGG